MTVVSCNFDVKLSDSKALQENGLVKQKVVEDMNKNRGDAFQARMQRGKQTARALKDVDSTPTVALTTSNLNAIRDVTYGVHSNDVITVCVEARIGTKISTKLGAVSRAFTADTNVEGALFISTSSVQNLISSLQRLFRTA